MHAYKNVHVASEHHIDDPLTRKRDKGCVQIVDRTRVDGALLTTSDALDFFDNSHEVSAYDAEFGRSIIARKGTQVTNTHNSATRALIKSYRVLSRAL